MSRISGQMFLALLIVWIVAMFAFFPRAHAQEFQSPQDFARQQTRGGGAKVDPSVAAPMRLSGARFVLASWYGGGERLNRHTANGERFNPRALTAAHRTLPMGARLLVAYAGHSVVVRINDRGPAAYTGRSLDLSRAAARVLGITGAGVARVAIRRVA